MSTEEKEEETTQTEESQTEETVETVEAKEPEFEAPEDPSHELSRPRIIDLKELLKPISGESPSGEYLRYAGVYDELAEARRADEALAMGDWQTELKVADFRKVIDTGVSVLTTQTKDLQIAAWLVEAICAEHGFGGLRDGLDLLSGLLTRFWDTLYPEAEDGDEEGRANALEWVDRETGLLIRNAAITVDGWGYNGFEDSKKFDYPDHVDGLSSEEQKRISDLRQQAERENRATATKWQVAVAKTNRAFCEEVKVAIDECYEAYKNLNAAIEKVFDRNQAPSLPEIKKALDLIKDAQGHLLAQKRAEEPDPADFEEQDGEEAPAGTGGAAGSMTGAVQNRQDALRRLAEIGAFFKRTEPQSPVAYLVSRAVTWGNMPLESWLEDVIKDKNILAELRQTLGFNTVSGAAEGTGAPPAGSAPQGGSMQGGSMQGSSMQGGSMQGGSMQGSANNPESGGNPPPAPSGRLQ
ncbi:MAG: type VI secretion system protein TssA [Pyrinomonadaceae bacterium]